MNIDLSALFMTAAAATGVLAAAAWLTSCVFTVQQKQEALVTRFGKHIRTEKDPGLHLKAPYPFNEVTAKIATDLQQVAEPLETKTRDDLFVRLPITIQYEVSDSAKFYFDNKDPIANMKKLVSAAVRTATARKEFQELYGDRDEISTAVIDHIKTAVAEYGINVRRIIIDEPQAPEQVQKAFNEVRASERLKEAARNKADAHAIEVVAKAEAEKQADVLRGQGKAGFRKEIFDQYSGQIRKLESEGVSRGEAITMMMQAMQQDTLRDVGDKGNLVIVTDGQSTGGVGRNIAEMQAALRGPAARPVPPPTPSAPL